jgi:hypothetical protein
MSTAVYPILASGLINTLTDAMQAEPVEDWLPETVEEAISICRQARRAVKGMRHEQEQALQSGLKAKVFVAQIEPRAQVMEQGLAVLSQLVQGLRGQVLGAGMKDFLSEAQALVREVADLHSFLSEVLAKAKALPRPMDWDRVQEAEEAYARGETKPFRRHPKAEAKE